MSEAGTNQPDSPIPPIADLPAILIEAPPPVFVPGTGVPARIPHLGHALLFFSIAGLSLFLIQAVLLGLLPSHSLPGASALVLQPRWLVLAEIASYLLTLALSWFIFPLLWHRPFADGLAWNVAAAKRNVVKLIPLGIALGLTVQAISSLVPMPKDIPMDEFFRRPADVWLITAFGTLLAPLFEEICFRGFLLPAFAIAYDWLSLPRTPLAREHWRRTTRLTPAGLVFSATLTSILFALLHAQQLAHAWAALFILLCLSLVLCLVRIRTASVACSALVHATYNASVFLTVFLATGGYRHLERITH